jgi:protein disulfide-isomerase
MKRSIFIIAILTLLFINASAENKDNINDLTWLNNLEKAQEIAKEKGLPIFVDFTGSDWCGWCFKLRDEIFSQEEFIQYSTANLVLVKLDFPRDIPQTKVTKAYNENLARKYEIRGFPTILLLNSNGQVIAQTGYQYGGAAKYVEHLQELLEAGKL